MEKLIGFFSSLLDTDTTLHALENHGLAIVLLVVIVFFALPKFNQLWKLWFRGYSKAVGHGSVSVATVKRDAAIRELGLECLYGFEADWCQIFQYHNGGVNAAGIPFKKHSCTQEFVRPGTISTYRNFQGMPSSLAWMWNEAVVNKTCFYLPNRKLIERMDPAACGLMAEYGMVGSNSLGLYDLHQNPIGFICLLYKNEAPKLTDDELKDFRNISTRIGSLLSEAIDPERP